MDILADIIGMLKPAGKLLISNHKQHIVDVISDLMMTGFSKISKVKGSGQSLKYYIYICNI